MGNRKRDEQEAVMTRAAIRLVLWGALVCLTATAARAQTTTTSETKKFQIISVDGNTLVVKLPEGTREIAVADDFRFNVDGKLLSVQELRPGMSGTATITARTTVTPVVVTEVKNGTVMQNLGTSILVRTEDGIRMFSQADIDKRGIKVWREGQLAEISDFRANDKLTATIVTTKPPRVMTEKEVQRPLPRAWRRARWRWRRPRHHRRHGARPLAPAPRRRRPLGPALLALRASSLLVSSLSGVSRARTGSQSTPGRGRDGEPPGLADVPE
jgi:hypothetical protein